MQPLRTTRTHGLIALLALGLTACGGEETPAPAILSLTASPTTVEVGGTVDLSWATEHADSVTLTDPQDTALDLAGQPPAGGTVTVTLATVGEHTYSLTALGPEGTTPAEGTVTVQATAPPAPTVADFSADPASVPVGTSTTLSWTVEDAVEVVVAGDGAELSRDTAGTGSQVVSPETTTTYTLTATGRGGDETVATLEVVVHPLPTVDLFEIRDGTGTPLTGAIQGGDEVTLAWDTTHADAVAIQDAAGNDLGQDAPDGTFTFVPELSTTYTLTATGPGGSASAEVQVNVLAVVQAFTITGPGDEPGAAATVRQGDLVTLSWATHGATGATLVGPGGPISLADVKSGSVEVVADQAGDYTLSLSPTGLFSEATVSVALTDAPRIRGLNATPNPVGVGQTVAVSWTQAGAEALTLTATHPDAGVPPVIAADVDLGAGTATLVLPAPGDWTLVAEAGNSLTTETHSRTLLLDVRAPPEVRAFAARPARTVSGGVVNVTWEAYEAETTTLLKDGVPVSGFPGSAQGVFEDVAVADATYELQADNGIGTVVTSAPIEVTVGAPEIVSFTSDRQFYAPEAEVTLSWENLGGRTLEVLDVATGTPIPGCALAGAFDAIAAGSCTFALPATQGTHDFQLKVVDDTAETTATLSVEVIDGPVIRQFQASADLVTAEAALTFYAQVDRALDGTAPTLSLVDQYGTRFDVLSWDPDTGEVEGTLAPSASRDYVFTLTASTPDTTPSTASVEVTVVPPPAIDEFIATNRFLSTDPDGQGSTTLSWLARDASEIALYLLGVETPIFSSEDPAFLSTGAYEVAPDATSSFRLVARNRAGSVATADLEIGVDLPVFTSLQGTNSLGVSGPVVHVLRDDADPTTLGDVATIAWTTERADRVLFSQPIPEVTEGDQVLAVMTDPTLSEVTELNIEAQTDMLMIGLPFEVPFYGRLSDDLVVAGNGWVSLDAAATYYKYKLDLPSSTGARALIAPMMGSYITPAPDGSSTTWTARGTDAERGEFFLVQWLDYRIDGATLSSLNFQVKLFASGDIEFAYGTMEAPDPSWRDKYAKGYYATIGIQNYDRDLAAQYSYNKAVLDPLVFTSLFFDYPSLAPADSMEVSYTDDEQVLGYVAVNENGATEGTVTVVTWSDLSDETGDSFTLAEPAQAGSPVDASWNIPEATRVELRANGEVVCENEADRDNVAGCSWTPPADGTYTMVLHYENPVSSGSVEKTLEVAPRLAIESFLVDGQPEVVLPGSRPVELTWEVTGAVDLLLLDGRTGEDLSLGCPDLLTTHRCSVTPGAPTRFELYVTDVPGWADGDRLRYASVDVRFSDTTLDAFDVSRTQVWAGGDVEVSWAGSSSDPEATYAVGPLFSTRYGVPFETLAGDHNAREVVRDNNNDPLEGFAVVRDEGFAFPYGGQLFQTFWVDEDGWVAPGFEPSSFTVNKTMAEAPGGIIAPAKFYTGYPDIPYRELYKVMGPPGNRALVIEWDDKIYSSDSGAMELQLALFDDGRMEFRYGDIQVFEPEGTDSYNWTLRRMLGGSVVSGWTSLDGSEYLDIVGNTYRPDLIGPGIVHTLYPPEARASGTRTYGFAEDGEISFCAAGGGVSLCEAQAVVVVAPGDVLITEVMMDPSPVADAEGEWVELRNVSSRALDLQGWVLSDGDGAYTFPTDAPVLVAPGEYVLVARNAAAGLGTPYVWSDPNLDLDDDAGTLTLTYGPLVVDTMSWDRAGDWQISGGRSVALDPSVHAMGPTDNDDWLMVDRKGNLDQRWCAADARDTYAQGLTGSPGWTGFGCRTPTYDLEPFAQGAFAFQDIRATGRRLPLRTVPSYTSVAGGLGFQIDYFGRLRDDLWVGTGGWLALESDDPGAMLEEGSTKSLDDNKAIPYDHPANPSPSGVIAPYWDQLDPVTDTFGNVLSTVHVETLGEAPNRVTVVQWSNWQVYDEGVGGVVDGRLTFQAQIHETGDIVFAYGDIDVRSAPVWADGYIQGGSASIGIENPNNQSGVQHGFNTDHAVYPGQVLWFRRR